MLIHYLFYIFVDFTFECGPQVCTMDSFVYNFGKGYLYCIVVLFYAIRFDLIGYKCRTVVDSFIIFWTLRDFSMLIECNPII